MGQSVTRPRSSASRLAAAEAPGARPAPEAAPAAQPAAAVVTLAAKAAGPQGVGSEAVAAVVELAATEEVVVAMREEPAGAAGPQPEAVQQAAQQAARQAAQQAAPRVAALVGEPAAEAL